MRTNQERQKVLEYHSAGLNQTEISRLTNIPKRTISGWVKQPEKNVMDFNSQEYVIDNKLEHTYSYILGLYLGDGYINKTARTWRLRIFLDVKYPKLNEFVIQQLQQLFPKNKVSIIDFKTYWGISVYSNKIISLFPQHGEGMKHTRKIELSDWQDEIIKSKDFVKGLFHSDGSYYFRKNKRGDLKYPAYDFRNESDDLHELFQKHCENLNILTTFSTKPKTTHIYKKIEVSNMMGIVGTKEKI